MANPDSTPPGANFLQFISGIAVQTLVHLGKMSNPMTNQTGIDLPNAKYSIDILGILQDKTKGNLNPQENEYLQNVLRDLRLEYVAVTGSEAAKSEIKNETGEKRAESANGD